LQRFLLVVLKSCERNDVEDKVFALRFLHSIIRVCWPRIPAHQGVILRTLAVVRLSLADEKKASNNELHQEVANAFELLRLCCGSALEVKKNAQSLLNPSQAHFFSSFIFFFFLSSQICQRFTPSTPALLAPSPLPHSQNKHTSKKNRARNSNGRFLECKNRLNQVLIY